MNGALPLIGMVQEPQMLRRISVDADYDCFRRQIPYPLQLKQEIQPRTLHAVPQDWREAESQSGKPYVPLKPKRFEPSRRVQLSLNPPPVTIVYILWAVYAIPTDEVPPPAEGIGERVRMGASAEF